MGCGLVEACSLLEERLCLQTRLNKVSFPTLICSCVVSGVQTSAASCQLCLTTLSPGWCSHQLSWALLKCSLRGWVRGRLCVKGTPQAIALWEEQGAPDQGVSLIPHR